MDLARPRGPLRRRDARTPGLRAKGGAFPRPRSLRRARNPPWRVGSEQAQRLPQGDSLEAACPRPREPGGMDLERSRHLVRDGLSPSAPVRQARWARARAHRTCGSRVPPWRLGSQVPAAAGTDDRRSRPPAHRPSRMGVEQIRLEVRGSTTLAPSLRSTRGTHSSPGWAHRTGCPARRLDPALPVPQEGIGQGASKGARKGTRVVMGSTATLEGAGRRKRPSLRVPTPPRSSPAPTRGPPKAPRAGLKWWR
jgi:hypothetical protein